MNTLQIPVTAVGSGIRLEVTAPFTDVMPAGAEPLPLDKIHLEGDLSPADDDFLFSGFLQAVFFQACDRCLKEVELALAVEVFWTFEEGPVLTELERMMRDDENLSGIWTFQGAEVDLRLPVYDECVLAMPSKFLCSTDCAGLCPECGQPVSDHDRPCPGTAQDEPIVNKAFAGLADLFPELAPKRTEE